MRHKVYTREHILKAAYEVISKEGFSNFTARNIAKKMGVSTQPIYLEFKNMQDLKNTLLQTVYEGLEEKLFSIEHKGDKLVDVAINYIEFSQSHNKLFTALFVEEHGGGSLIYDYSFKHFKRIVAEVPKCADFSEHEIKILHQTLWVSMTGVAALMTSGVIEPTEEQLMVFINKTIDSGMHMIEQQVL